jgi:hypothetical protein
MTRYLIILGIFLLYLITVIFEVSISFTRISYYLWIMCFKKLRKDFSILVRFSVTFLLHLLGSSFRLFVIRKTLVEKP